MAVDQFALAAAIAAGGLLAWTVRLLWVISARMQADRDATAANTRAVDRLTEATGKLTERVARLEGIRELRRPR